MDSSVPGQPAGDFEDSSTAAAPEACSSGEALPGAMQPEANPDLCRAETEDYPTMEPASEEFSGPVSDSEIPWRGMASLPAPEPPAVGVLHGGEESCASCEMCGNFSAEDLLEDTELVLGLKLSQYGPVYFFKAGQEAIRAGAKVLVETDQGIALGEVATARRLRVPLPKIRTEDGEEVEIKPIIGLAGPKDIAAASDNRILAASARLYCKECIRERELDMKLVDVEVLHDRSKIIFYFTAPARIDFRELVKDLVRNYHTRIELRQIGVRHETQMIGAVGNCGMTCCCRRYLRKFAPVTIKMAKEQNLFLNPAKLSGICGRLLCCLAYEQENYEEFHKRSPKIGKKYSTTQGLMRVLRANLFRQSIFVLDESNEERELQLDEWEELQPTRQDVPSEYGNDRGERPDSREGRERRPRRHDEGRPRGKTHDGEHNGDGIAAEDAAEQEGRSPREGGPAHGKRHNQRDFKAERPDRTDRAERGERSERERQDRPDRPDRPDRVDRPDRQERTERQERAERPEDRQNQRDRSPDPRERNEGTERGDSASHERDGRERHWRNDGQRDRAGYKGQRRPEEQAARDGRDSNAQTPRDGEARGNRAHAHEHRQHSPHPRQHAQDSGHETSGREQSVQLDGPVSAGRAFGIESKTAEPRSGAHEREAADVPGAVAALAVTSAAGRFEAGGGASGSITAGVAAKTAGAGEISSPLEPAGTAEAPEADNRNNPGASSAAVPAAKAGPATEDKSIFGLPGSRYSQHNSRNDRRQRPGRNRK